MWIDDLTKALYFLNATDYKWLLVVSRIEDDIIYFTTGERVHVKELVAAYGCFIRTGKVMEIRKSP